MCCLATQTHTILSNVRVCTKEQQNFEKMLKEPWSHVNEIFIRNLGWMGKLDKSTKYDNSDEGFYTGKLFARDRIIYNKYYYSRTFRSGGASFSFTGSLFCPQSSPSPSILRSNSKNS